MWVCVCVEYKGQQRPETLFLLELESRAVVSYLTWVLGIEPRPLRAVYAATAEPPLSFSVTVVAVMAGVLEAERASEMEGHHLLVVPSPPECHQCLSVVASPLMKTKSLCEPVVLRGHHERPSIQLMSLLGDTSNTSRNNS